MMDNIRWGIIGTGNIANQFARGLRSVADADLVAVGSRSQANADAFADEYGAPNRHDSYEALANDPNVDAVYISTPHVYHKENTLLCLEAGKAVLCEKPFAINVKESREMVALAREKGVFLMEAMWTRFIPAMVRVRELLAEGALGEINYVYSDFGFRTEVNPEGRLFNLELGGGALLDVGIYPVSLAHLVMGKPESIVSSVRLGETDVDEQSVVTLQYPDGKLAVAYSAIVTDTPQRAEIFGTEGWIEMHPRWFIPETFTLHMNDKDLETITVPYEGNGYNYEAMEVGACIRAGKTESDVMPLDETLEIMETLDTVRQQWNLTYPGESA